MKKKRISIAIIIFSVMCYGVLFYIHKNYNNGEKIIGTLDSGPKSYPTCDLSKEHLVYDKKTKKHICILGEAQ